MTAANELKVQIKAIIFDLNAQLAQLRGIQISAEQSGQQLLALNTYDMDVSLTAGRLMNGTWEEIEHLANLYRVHIMSLEHYITEVL